MNNDCLAIKDLSLSGHTVRALNRAGICTVGQLKELSDMELLSLNGIGWRSLREIIRCVPDKIRERENEWENPKLTPEKMLHMSDISDVSIDEMCLSIRTYNILNRAGIRTVKQIRGYTDNELLHLRNFGAKCLEEINGFVPDRIKERSVEEKSSVTAEDIINMLESGMKMISVCIRYNKGIHGIEQILCDYCNDFPEGIDRLINVYEKQFEMTDSFYGLLKQEKRNLQQQTSQ